MTIATLSHVKETLGDLHAKKKFGQNFLIDANIVDKIARKAVEEELTVIEIGPGLGDQLLCQKPDDAAHNYCERIYYNAYHKVIYLKLLGFGIIVGFGSGFCFNPCNFVLVNIDFCHKLLKS